MGICVILAGVLFYFLFYGVLPSQVLLVLSAAVCGAYFFYQKRHRHHHGAFLSIDTRAQQSRLNRYHPGLKVCFSVVCALLCIAANSVAVSMFVVVTMLLLTVLAGKIPLHYYLSLLAVPLVFILLGTVAILFEVSPAPLGLLDIPVGGRFVCITPGSQSRALAVLCRAFGAVSCLYLLSLSTPMYQIISFFRKVHVPDVVAELMYLIYRYIFVLLETQNQMHIAAQSRLGYRNWRRGLRTMLNSSLNLLFLSFRRSSDCFAAMESRCYDGAIAFWEEKVSVKGLELAAVAVYIAVLVTLWFWIGRNPA